MDEADRAFFHYSANLDTWARDRDMAGKYVLVGADGKPDCFDDLRKAYSAAHGRRLLGKCHLGLAYPSKEQRCQLAAPEFKQRNWGQIVELTIGLADIDTRSERRSFKCDFVVDTGALCTLVPDAKLKEIDAPEVGRREVLTGAGMQRLPVYLVSLTNGPFRRDDWSVVGTPLGIGLIGMDLLSGCRIAYPVDGEFKIEKNA